MIIIAAPSGAGKSSFVSRITQEMPRLRDTVTYTTRAMRAGESEGVPYHFVSREKFETLVREDFFVEWAVVHGNLYGTPFYQIRDAWDRNEVVIMDVDVQGADTFKRKFPDDAVSIFIVPPSIEELRRRVVKRDGKIPADLEVRMANAEKEIRRADDFDYQVVNDDFDKSYLQFKKIIEDLLKSR
ncbi:MAG: guanylate kinase [Bdellovibrionaceae bacterium]|nr:guanylate kinase [Pseudobdellovibrionaceae bacterium]